ncbi:MAG: hypothetical protein WC900_07575 [Oscillospiraceae bacterium]|jgi:hypothetical protein
MKAHIINGSSNKNLGEMRRYFKIVFAMLHLDFGFGNERLNKALDGINRLSDEAKQDPIFWEHIDKLLIDQMKIDFEREDYERVDK